MLDCNDVVQTLCLSRCRSGSSLPICTFDCGEGLTVSGSVRTATCTGWNDKRDDLLAMGVKLSGIGASVAQDLEPECVTFSAAGNIAFVALQVGGGVTGNATAALCRVLNCSQPGCGSSAFASRGEISEQCYCYSY
jgi:hypothetical protein